MKAIILFFVSLVAFSTTQASYDFVNRNVTDEDVVMVGKRAAMAITRKCRYDEYLQFVKVTNADVKWVDPRRGKRYYKITAEYLKTDCERLVVYPEEVNEENCKPAKTCWRKRCSTDVFLTMKHGVISEYRVGSCTGGDGTFTKCSEFCYNPPQH